MWRYWVKENILLKINSMLLFAFFKVAVSLEWDVWTHTVFTLDTASPNALYRRLLHPGAHTVPFNRPLWFCLTFSSTSASDGSSWIAQLPTSHCAGDTVLGTPCWGHRATPEQEEQRKQNVSWTRHREHRGERTSQAKTRCHRLRAGCQGIGLLARRK